MIMNGIYAQEVKLGQKVDQGKVKSNPSSEYKVGQELEGKILQVSEQISIDFSGREARVSRSTIPDAREGEIRKFKITEISNNGIVLKEIGSTTKHEESSGMNKIVFTKTDVDASSVLTTKNKEEEVKENELDEISSKMTAHNLEDIRNEVVSLESYELELLEKALERVKLQRSLKMDHKLEQVEQLKDRVEKARKLAIGFLPEHPAIEKIAESLVKADLPVTQDNISRIANALKLSSVATQLNHSSAAFLIKNELEPSIENIYKAVHSGKTNPIQKQETEFKEIAETVGQIISDADIEDKDSAMKQAKWLFQSNLNITEENIKYKMELDDLPMELSMDMVADQAAYSLAKGHKAETALISLKYKIRMEEARLKLTYDAQVNMLNKGIKVDTEGLELSVDSLRRLEQEFYKTYLGDRAENLTEKLGLIEHAVTSVEDLKQASVHVLGITFEQRHEITFSELHEKAVIRVGKYQQDEYERGEKYQAQEKSNHAERFQYAERSYETLMTAPRKDLGDSIQKAFQNVDSQLELLGLETTKINQRAVRILAYNQIELTKENVTAMKAYDAKVNNIFQNMTPTVITAMVKDGVNPLNYPIDELSDITNLYQERLGDSPEVKYSEYLVDLERNKEITKEQRNAYIGIYRLLHQVKTSDGAAIGAVVKAGQEITLNALLTQVRTSNKGSFDYSINDEQGTTQGKGGYSNSITDSINGYYSELSSYQQSVVSSLLQEIDANAISNVAKKFEDQLYDISLEKLQQELVESETDTKASQTERMLHKISDLSREGSKMVSFLDNYQIPDSIQNIAAVKNMVELNGDFYEKSEKALKDKLVLREYSAKLLDGLNDFDNFDSTYTEMNEEIVTKLKSEVFSEDNQEITFTNMKDLNALCDIYSLNQKLQKKEFYHIPFEINDSLVNVNLTVIHDQVKGGKIRISMPTQQLGRVTVEASMNQGKIRCLITSDKMSSIPLLKNEAINLDVRMNAIGFSIEQQHYSFEIRDLEQFVYASGSIYKESQRARESKEERMLEQDANTKTNDLYQVTKELLSHLAMIESGINR